MNALALGLSIGLAAGISPGPLLVLVLTSTLKFGWRAGALVACAPLVTDLLVVAVALLFLDRISGLALAILGVLGGGFVGWIGLSTIRDARRTTPLPSTSLVVTSDQPAGSGNGSGNSALPILRQAALVNLLSPHPWITWITALGPLVIATSRDRPAGGVVLVAGFYLALVGAKVVVAMLVAGGRPGLSDAGYRRALVGAGGLLILAGLALFIEFVPQLGI